MRKIKSLTPAQEKALASYRDEWLRIGLSTDRTDLEAAKAAVRAIWQRHLPQKPVPHITLWDGPLFAHLGAPLMAPLGHNLWDNLRDNTEANLREVLWGGIREQLWGNLRENLWGNLWAPLEGNIRKGFEAGQLNAYWIAFYGFPHRHLRPMHSAAQMQALEEWEALAKSVFIWYACETQVVIIDRPLCIHKDDRGRLHAEDGPALAFRDGWALWYYHGVQVPRRVIMEPHTITAHEALGERNAEVRRVMIKRMGCEKLLSHAVDAVSDDYGTLHRVTVPGDEDVVFVALDNSTAEPDGTRRKYFLRVPPDIQTPLEGVAWTFELSAAEYAPYKET